MRIRNRQTGEGRPTLQMTAMIDIVFQLLVFFLITFRIGKVEGDFNVAMPTYGAGPQISDGWTARLTVASDFNGNVRSIALGEQSLPTDDWDAVHRALTETFLLMTEAGNASIEIDLDPRLRYEHTVAAITAASGERTAAGDIVKLFEDIRLLPPRAIN